MGEWAWAPPAPMSIRVGLVSTPVWRTPCVWNPPDRSDVSGVSASPRWWDDDQVAIHPFSLSIADIQMAMEMFDASPDGAVEHARVMRVAEELPDTSVELGGHWCGPDCNHRG